MALVIDQPYNEYTAQDHAVWRYVMRQNVRYLGKVAHGSYLGGLQKTGISIDEIPHMYGMNRILKEIGWAAVAVDGFIPPAAFMEFQAYNVLVIAADIRPIDQIEYTPAPDIIHEAAGHAPIIADPEYAEYLKYFGYIGYKAFSSKRDYQLYEAIRHLSILKADPYSSKEDIARAVEHLEFLERNMGPASEMARIRNLHWWTVEYGLIGSLNDPKIYGAGLLSSIGESVNALSDKVEKRHYDFTAADVGFDITTMQPQLFVTPDFEHLTRVLEEFADTMALRRGGQYALEQAVGSANHATVEYSSGLQVSGIFNDFIHDEELIYVQTNSPTILSADDKVLPGHGLEDHKDGYGSPVGMWKAVDKKPENLDQSALNNIGLEEGKYGTLEFRSGLKVEGRVSRFAFHKGKLLLITWEDCTVRYEDKVLFQPSYGRYDMAVGSEITSGYTGPADPVAYKLSYQAPEEKTHKIVHAESARKLQAMYQDIRDLRSKGSTNGSVASIWERIRKEYSEEWLAPLELLELVYNDPARKTLSEELLAHLENLRNAKPEASKLITDGIELVKGR